MKDVFPRNCLKKAGQVGVVKLLPKVVSNGLGRGEFEGEAPIEVVEGAEPCEVEFAAGVIVNCMSTDDVVFEGVFEECEGTALVVVMVSNSDPPFCRA